MSSQITYGMAVNCVAEALNASLPTVTVYRRVFGESFSSYFHAADSGTRANHLIAGLVAVATANRATMETRQLFEALLATRLHTDTSSPATLPAEASAVDAIALQLIQAARAGKLSDDARLEIHGPMPRVIIETAEGRWQFSIPFPARGTDASAGV